MAKIAVYFNSRASNFKKYEWKKQFSKYLFRHEITFYAPNSLQELKYSLKKNKSDLTQVIFIVGGDGTVNSILPELVDGDFKIVLIPAGTANDLASELGLSLNISKIIKAFQHNTLRFVDVVSVNSSYFLTVGGIGLASRIVKQVNNIRTDYPQFKKIMSLTGEHIYGFMLAKELLLGKLKRTNMRIEFQREEESFTKEIELSMLYICNQSTLGGSFNLAPKAKNNDGILNIVIFCHQSKKELMKAAIKIRQGKTPEDDPYLIQLSAKSLRISSYENKVIPFFGDGEELGKSHYFDIKILEKKLQFYCLDQKYNYDQSHPLTEIQGI